VPYRIQQTFDGSWVTIVFQGRLDASDGQKSASEVAALLDEQPRVLVWDLRGMSGYATEARVAWQSTLWPRRQRILEVRVVGGNPLVRVGAVTLGSLLSVPIRFNDDPTS
jgi:hypothetical protein